VWCCSLSVSLLVLGFVSEQHGSWSDCADAQAGLDPCWSKTHYVGFVVKRLKYDDTFNVRIRQGRLIWYNQLFQRGGWSGVTIDWRLHNYIITIQYKQINIYNCIQRQKTCFLNALKEKSTYFTDVYHLIKTCLSITYCIRSEIRNNSRWHMYENWPAKCEGFIVTTRLSSLYR
jgi:hypothetical protein